MGVMLEDWVHRMSRLARIESEIVRLERFANGAVHGHCPGLFQEQVSGPSSSGPASGKRWGIADAARGLILPAIILALIAASSAIFSGRDTGDESSRLIAPLPIVASRLPG